MPPPQRTFLVPVPEPDTVEIVDGAGRHVGVLGPTGPIAEAEHRLGLDVGPEPVPDFPLRVELRKARQTDKPNVVEGEIRAISLPDLLSVADQVAFSKPGHGYCIDRAIEVDGIVSVTTGGNQIHQFDAMELVGVIVRWPKREAS